MGTSGNERYWSLLSTIYDRFMRKDAKAYIGIANEIRLSLKRETTVLELATGTGSIALLIAEAAGKVTATDFSEGMIQQARSKPHPDNVVFEVMDACALEYPDASFDVVIISNALHIMPDPRTALANIKRVLKDDGILIAPNFMHISSFQTEILSKLLRLAGLKTYVKWNRETYLDFLRKNGWTIRTSKLVPASFPICYVEAGKTIT